MWQIELGWPDMHWLARDKGGLVAAIFETWALYKSDVGARVGSLSLALPYSAPIMMGSIEIGNLVEARSWLIRSSYVQHPGLQSCIARSCAS
jgi:hypothetical protein